MFRDDARPGRRLWFWLVMAVLVRLFAMELYPLLDTTEARYAEVARKMLALHDWVTPWFDDGVPYWGKPPLSFWMTMLGFKAFGINEFAARLPHYLCGMLILWIVWRWAARRSSREALFAITLLLGSSLYFIASGLVMTDMWLLLATTLSMQGFWSAMRPRPGDSPHERWLLFVGLGIGLLAKGPIAVAITGMAILAWMVIRGEYRSVWRALPWVRGSLLTALIAVPWYVIAEQKTPGFLNYFLVGEHYHRFVTPGWQGDRYGTAHAYPRGTIWGFMALDSLPWILLLPVVYWRLRKAGGVTPVAPADRDWNTYLLCWALVPPVFFTFAGNIIWPYVLPGFPALALWLAGWLKRETGLREGSKEALLQAGLACTVLIMLAGLVGLHVTGVADLRSMKTLQTLYEQHRARDEKLVYFGNEPFSGEYYSRGMAKRAPNTDTLQNFLQGEPFYLAIETDTATFLPAEWTSRMTRIGARGKYTLFYARHAVAGTRKPSASVVVAHYSGAD